MNCPKCESKKAPRGELVFFDCIELWKCGSRIMKNNKFFQDALCQYRQLRNQCAELREEINSLKDENTDLEAVILGLKKDLEYAHETNKAVIESHNQIIDKNLKLQAAAGELAANQFCWEDKNE